MQTLYPTLQADGLTGFYQSSAASSDPASFTAASTPQTVTIDAQRGCASPTIPLACPVCLAGELVEVRLLDTLTWWCTHCTHTTLDSPLAPESLPASVRSMERTEDLIVVCETEAITAALSAGEGDDELGAALANQLVALVEMHSRLCRSRLAQRIQHAMLISNTFARSETNHVA